MQDRPLWPAIWKGLRCRCPNCGQAPLLYRYLKVQEACPTCGEDFRAQRADDGPAYLTIFVAGHIMIPVLHVVYVYWRPEAWVMAVTLPTLAVLLSLWLLPRMKGLVVAFQWAKRMHGFGTKATP